MAPVTGTMEHVGGPGGGEARPGIVLLCAKDFATIPHAVPLRGAELVVGREPAPGQCRIPQSAVSREHARLVRTPAGWEVADLGSRNGTFVDGRRVQRAPLHDRSTVRIGDTLFAFVADGIDGWLRYRIDGAGNPPSPVPELVGGQRMALVAEQIETVAASALSVLVLGETGTGKEVAAHAVHRLSGRRGPFSAVNCAAIPPHLFESELFGYRKGAFTGADRDKPGILHAAHGGTVLLDELGDMPVEAQAKLLRAIETGEVAALGAVRPDVVDVRFVCATHRDLPALVRAGRFRADLYARVSAVSVRLPPLRDRKEDLYLLVTHFLRAQGAPHLDPSFAFMLGVCDYDWPGNVRELRAAIARAVTMVDGPALVVRHLPPVIAERMKTYGAREPPGESEPAPVSGRAMPDVEAVRALLVEHAGNVAAVARAMKKDRAQVHRLIQRYGLVPEDFRGRREPRE